MMLPTPNLDDRTWSDLAEEGRNIIPRYAPEWTDFNIHDPGISIIELLAWIAEMDVYALNRIPVAHRRKFLALLGITPRPPQAAQTVVHVTLPENAAPLSLPASTEIETGHHLETVTRFRTRVEMTAVSSSITALWRRDQAGWHNLTTFWQNQEPLAIFGDATDPNPTFYIGFSKPLPPNEQVSLYLQFADCQPEHDVRQRLQDEWLARQKSCQAQPNPCQPESVGDTAVPIPPAAWPHHSAQTVWEFAHKYPSTGKLVWQPLTAETEIEDATRACTLSGFVRLTLPAEMTATKPSPSAPSLYYLRCRQTAGEYDAPPTLQTILVNAVPVEQAVPASTHFIVAQGAAVSPPGSDPAPGTDNKFRIHFNETGEIDSLDFLPAEADAPAFFITHWQAPANGKKGELGVELAYQGVGLGEPGQTVTLDSAPVQALSVAIYTLEGDQWHSWAQRPDFDNSLRNGRHFLLNTMSGTVTFGDGEKGLPVPKGALIFAADRHTRAAQGNVKPGQPWQLSPSAHNKALGVTGSQVKIANTFPAAGGENAETIAHAEGRALAEVNRITRAITLADIEHLALNTPGTCLARAAVKANLDPRYPCLQAPGTTTVVLLPKSKAAQPQPSAGLRRAVQQYLNRRRIIGSRLMVVGPTYTQVTVQARVQRQTQASQARVQAAVVQALDDFFSPLHGGPDKTGWPFGRDVYRSEVMQVIDGVAGVENVISLELVADGGEPACGNLCLGPCGLVVSGPHQIIVE